MGLSGFFLLSGGETLGRLCGLREGGQFCFKTRLHSASLAAVLSVQPQSPCKACRPCLGAKNRRLLKVLK